MGRKDVPFDKGKSGIVAMRKESVICFPTVGRQPLFLVILRVARVPFRWAAGNGSAEAAARAKQLLEQSLLSELRAVVARALSGLEMFSGNQLSELDLLAPVASLGDSDKVRLPGHIPIHCTCSTRRIGMSGRSSSAGVCPCHTPGLELESRECWDLQQLCLALAMLQKSLGKSNLQCMHGTSDSNLSTTRACTDSNSPNSVLASNSHCESFHCHRTRA